MFTGLIETVGRVVDVSSRPGLRRISIASGLPQDEMRSGESVAVDGVCLTVAGLDRDRFHADVVAETLSRTTLAHARPGQRVNLERALRLGDRLGGHFVQGHVDARAKVVRVDARGGDWRMWIGLGAALRRYVAEKGSVAVQGVSLTVAALGESHFEVALVPETLSRTTLGDLRAGQEVNVEVDLVARYLERLMKPDGLSRVRSGGLKPSSPGRRTRLGRP